MALENVMRVDNGNIVGGGVQDDTLVTYYKADLIDETSQSSNITLNTFNLTRIKNLPIGRFQVSFKSSVSVGSSGLNLGILKGDFFAGSRPVLLCVDDYDGSPGAAIYVNPSSYNVKVYTCEADHLYYVDAVVLLKDF